MSQAGNAGGANGGSTPSNVATSYITDAGTAIPVLNVLQVLGGAGAATTGAGNVITVTSSAVGVAWTNSAGGALVNKFGYFATVATVYTLPAGVTNGDTVEIVSLVGAGVVVTAQGGNIIRISNTTSTANGTATSSQAGDALRLIFSLTASAWICVPSAAGMWTLA